MPMSRNRTRVSRTYLDAGGNFLDTANIYTRGHTPESTTIGDFLKQSPSLRDRCVIATKFGGSLYAGDPNAGGSGRKSIYNACHQSLRRLQTDSIDLYWMHFSDAHADRRDDAGAGRPAAAGRLRYVGFSDTPAWRVTQAMYEARINHWTPLIASTTRVFAGGAEIIEGELVPAAKEFGLGITPWSPLRVAC